MALTKKALYMFLGGLLALGLVFGAAAIFAQSGDDDPQAEQTTPEQEDDTLVVPPAAGKGHWGMGDFTGDDTALAEALGITVDELQAAQQQVREALIGQAVADGLLTQEEADALLANGSGLHRDFGRGGHFGFGGNASELLAEALGITVEELDAARAEVKAAQLAAMVEAGYLTQEQADLMLARQAVENYIDREALQATIQAAYEAAVAQAVEDGAITQEQADALLSSAATMGGFGMRGFDMPGGMMGPHGGRGGHHGGMPGFFQNGQTESTTPAAGA